MCKNYAKCRNRTTTPNSLKCWIKWQLCGNCAVDQHPEDYTMPFVLRRTKSYLKKQKLL